jgi:hypothetical protein
MKRLVRGGKYVVTASLSLNLDTLQFALQRIYPGMFTAALTGPLNHPSAIMRN